MIQDIWFVRFGEYIGFWPGMLALVLTYIVGVVMAIMHYKRWAKRGLYIIALTASIVVLWNALKLVVLY